jgi:Ca2+-binding EF-hand superfamily protein
MHKNLEITENIQKLLPDNFEELVKSEFDNIDIDKNGFLSLEELMPVLNNMAKMSGHKKGITLEEAEQAMNHLDINKDKKLDILEFKKLFFALLMQYLAKQDS